MPKHSDRMRTWRGKFEDAKDALDGGSFTVSRSERRKMQSKHKKFIAAKPKLLAIMKAITDSGAGFPIVQQIRKFVQEGGYHHGI